MRELLLRPCAECFAAFCAPFPDCKCSCHKTCCVYGCSQRAVYEHSGTAVPGMGYPYCEEHQR